MASNAEGWVTVRGFRKAWFCLGLKAEILIVVRSRILNQLFVSKNASAEEGRPPAKSQSWTVARSAPNCSKYSHVAAEHCDWHVQP